jgi:hypothetical protein
MEKFEQRDGRQPQQRDQEAVTMEDRHAEQRQAEDSEFDRHRYSNTVIKAREPRSHRR